MELYVLDNNKNQIAVVDDYKSLIWAKRYSALGDCELYIRATNPNFEILQKGYFLVRSDDDMVCRIEDIELDTNVENGDYLIVKGFDVRKILNQRIVLDTISFSGLAEDFIRKIISQNVTNPSDNNRKIGGIVLGSKSNFTEQWEEQVTYSQVFDKIQEVCESLGYGSKLVLATTGNFRFYLYKGVNRSYGQNENSFVVFSPEFENIASSKYESKSSAFKNYAIVGGAGEGVDRAIKTVGNSAGINRFETFVDAKDVSREVDYTALIESYPNGTITTESGVVYYVYNNLKIAILDKANAPSKATLQDNVYLPLLIGKGEEILTEKSVETSFEGDVEPLVQFVYKKDFDLGDIVSVQNQYRIGEDARIIEIIETFDDVGHTVSLIFKYIGQAPDEPEQSGYILTENEETLQTESGDNLILERVAQPRMATISYSVGNKKISELEEISEINEGCCLPIVSDNETKKVTYGYLKEKLSAEFFPIGAIYLSVNSTNPENLFGGTWEQIKDKFLLSAGDNYSAGSTGGEAQHTLTVGEMPSHGHTVQTFPYAGSNSSYYQVSTNVGGNVDPNTNWTGGFANNTGGSRPHNNMPPYLTVYMWVRTA